MDNTTDPFLSKVEQEKIFPVSQESILREIRRRSLRRGSILGRIDVEIAALVTIPPTDRSLGQEASLRHLEIFRVSLLSETEESPDLGIFIAYRAAEKFLKATDPDVIDQIESRLSSQIPRGQASDVLVAAVLHHYRIRKAYRIFSENRMAFEVMHEVGRRIWRSGVNVYDPFDDQEAFEAIECEANRGMVRFLYENYGQAAIELFRQRLEIANLAPQT